MVLMASSKKSKEPKGTLPGWVYEVGAGLLAGFSVFAATNDWKMGVGTMLATLFGGGAHRFANWQTMPKPTK